MWRRRSDGHVVQVTDVRPGSGPDGTVYVRSLQDAGGWSPGDFRVSFDCVDEDSAKNALAAADRT